MALPNYIPVRTAGFRGVLELEQGKGLTAKVTVRSSGSLRWASTGELFEALGGTFTSGRGASVTFPLPVTDNDGWLTTANEIIDVSADGAYTHTYTATVVVMDASGCQVGSEYEYGPFVVPASESTLWLDELEDRATTAGSVVARPTVYAVNGQDGEVTITASGLGAYVKPGSGVPKTDLASAVRTSLEKADGAAQKDQNLNDVVDKAAARTNLDVFSKAEANAAIAEGVGESASLPAGKRALLFPEHLSRWRARREDSRWGLRHITASGHSVNMGYYANNASSDNYPVFRERGAMGRLRELLADRYGRVSYPGEEVWLVTPESRCATVGGSGQQVGPNKSGRTLSSASHTQTWTGVYGRYFRVPFWKNTTAADDASTVTVTIDGGTPVAITGQPSENDVTWMSQVIDAGSSGAHTVVITGPTNGKNATVMGLQVYDVDPTATKGIALHRWGNGGAYMTDQFHLAGNAKPRLLEATFELLPADLSTFWFISNEITGTGQGLGHTPTSLAALMSETVAYQTDTNGGSALIIAGPRRDPAQVGSTYTEQDYIDALIGVAEANPHCAFLDVARVWGGYADALANGFMHDGVHPNRLGHSDLARILFDAITG